MEYTREGRLEEIRRTLAVFLEPGQTTELRVLDVGGVPKKIDACFFTDHEALARRAVSLDEGGSRGCYFIPNPLRSDLVKPQDKGMRRGSASTEHVLMRHWMLIDIDPIRVDEDGHPLEGKEAQRIPTTDGEKLAALSVLDACRDTLEGLDFRNPVIGDSGNGWHLCYPICLPVDDHSNTLLKSMLYGLQERCGNEFASVDTSTHDAPRIWKLYGTLARKGPETDARPHRLAKLIEGHRPHD